MPHPPYSQLDFQFLLNIHGSSLNDTYVLGEPPRSPSPSEEEEEVCSFTVGDEVWRGVGRDCSSGHCALSVIYCQSRLIVLPSSSCAPALSWLIRIVSMCDGSAPPAPPAPAQPHPQRPLRMQKANKPRADNGHAWKGDYRSRLLGAALLLQPSAIFSLSALVASASLLLTLISTASSGWESPSPERHN